MRIAFVSFGATDLNSGSEVLWYKIALHARQVGDEVLVSIFKPIRESIELKKLQGAGAKLVFRRRYYPNVYFRAIKKLKNVFQSWNKATYHDYLLNFEPDHILFSLPGGTEIIDDNSDLMVLIKKIAIPYSIFYHSFQTEMRLIDAQKANFYVSASKARYNLFTSKMQATAYQKAAGIELANTKIINHPLRNIRYSGIEYDDCGELCISVIGNLVKRWKGQDLLLRAISLSPEWKMRKIKIKFFGEGSDKEELMQLSDSLGLNEIVTFRGFEPDINNILEETDILLIPSRQDSGPIVLFEALMAGKLVIGSRVGAIVDYIQDGETGFLIQHLNPDGVLDAINRAWISRPYWKTIAKRGRDYFMSNYDFNSVETLYSLLKK